MLPKTLVPKPNLADVGVRVPFKGFPYGAQDWVKAHYMPPARDDNSDDHNVCTGYSENHNALVSFNR